MLYDSWVIYHVRSAELDFLHMLSLKSCIYDYCCFLRLTCQNANCTLTQIYHHVRQSFREKEKFVIFDNRKALFATRLECINLGDFMLTGHKQSQRDCEVPNQTSV